MNKERNILIVGLGMIGASYAEKLHDSGYYVGGISARESTVSKALQEKIIDCGTTNVTKEFVGKFDIVVFAVYPKLLINWIKQHQDCFKTGALITDVTGVKCSIVYDIQKMLRCDVEFIAAHPMAGRELSGIDNRCTRVFEGANYIVTPTEKNTQEAIDTACELGRILGFGRISVITPEEHDEMIAFLSQLTHCIAVSLMCCKDSANLVDYTGDSFRDLTRIANINENMWPELFAMNKTQLLKQMNLFEKEFTRLKEAIAADDTETVRQMMITSTERRKLFNK
ncbi:MAG: prephenate dehydrogenase [Bacteroidales bacterium]|nr:prephenate dehydrogenase [Bacteroidales bacterium]